MLRVMLVKVVMWPDSGTVLGSCEGLVFLGRRDLTGKGQGSPLPPPFMGQEVGGPASGGAFSSGVTGCMCLKVGV